MSLNKMDNPGVSSRNLGLSLNLTPNTTFKSVFADDTPTPSRYLNALESEMYQEDNPFDATFRKANSISSPSILSLPGSALLACLPDSDVLNTPSIILPSEPSTPLILKSFPRKILEKTKSYNSEGTMDTLPFTPDTEEMEVVAATPASIANSLNVEEEANFPSLIVEPEIMIEEEIPVEKIPVQKLNVNQTTVITSVGNNVKPIATCVPTAVVVSRPTSIVRNIAPAQLPVVTEKPVLAKVADQQQAVVQSVCVTPMVQLLVRLADGQTMPLQFPVMNTGHTTLAIPTTTSAPVAAAASPPKNVGPVSKATLPVQTSLLASVAQAVQSAVAGVETPVVVAPPTTKMKLKEALKMNQRNGCNSKASLPRDKVAVPKPPSVLPTEEFLAQFGLSPPPSPTSANKPPSRKRREYSDNPDEKRRRSLERNRAAATRCREKRKQWVTALERKADELANTNTHLQNEVVQLRNEVAQLKRMLLAHKDCPVTQQQKGMALEAERDPYTTIHIISSSPEDASRAASSSSLGAEFMEINLGSVQSISDSSLTSDNSEASFKER